LYDDDDDNNNAYYYYSNTITYIALWKPSSEAHHYKEGGSISNSITLQLSTDGLIRKGAMVDKHIYKGTF